MKKKSGRRGGGGTGSGARTKPCRSRGAGARGLGAAGWCIGLLLPQSQTTGFLSNWCTSQFHMIQHFLVLFDNQ